MHLQGVAGLLVLTGLAWIISENRRKVNYRGVLAGLAVKVSVAALLLNVPVFKTVFLFLNGLVLSLEESTRAGTSFVFGYIGGGPTPFALKDPGSNFILAFQALPLVLVIGALSSLLFYWRILPYVVRVFSLALQKALNIGGALGLGASATVFLGMVEAPL
ncbi:MAG: Na+ dependent nucleoside transporter N-terminal domain-containing protein, partial [Dissulfurispiraceae bacterium]